MWNSQKLIFSGYPSDISIHLKMENNVLKNRDEDNKDADSIMKKYKVKLYNHIELTIYAFLI